MRAFLTSLCFNCSKRFCKSARSANASATFIAQSFPSRAVYQRSSDSKSHHAEKATLIFERGLYLCRQLPTLPHTFACSTIAQALTLPIASSRLANMEVHFRPETESRLQELASKSGRPPSDLIEDAMAGYLQELAQVREMLDGRHDDLKSGRLQPVEGEEAFARLRQKSKERRTSR